MIALASDVNYSEPVTTLIKSVCYHHQYVKFYLMNKDFPDEWFQSLNKHLNKISCEIVNVKVATNIFDDITILDRITSSALYRYFIQELPEERILYLDSDIIVDGCIREFYFTDFKDNLAVAVEDLWLNLEGVKHSYPDFPIMKPYFCSGVLLINNRLWQQYDLQTTLCEYTMKYKDFIYLDQDVLNIVLKDRWLAADKIYDYQLHANRIFITHNLQAELEAFNTTSDEPKIIHYSGAYKPWLAVTDKCNLKFREKYWHYYQLEWADIINKQIKA